MAHLLCRQRSHHDAPRLFTRRPFDPFEASLLCMPSNQMAIRQGLALRPASGRRAVASRFRKFPLYCRKVARLRMGRSSAGVLGLSCCWSALAGVAAFLRLWRISLLQIGQIPDRHAGRPVFSSLHNRRPGSVSNSGSDRGFRISPHKVHNTKI
jgi:hypothetical protein